MLSMIHYLQHALFRIQYCMDIVKDQKDLVLGAKGAGKSAVWKEIFEHQQNYHQLADVRMRVIANPSGDPEFRDVLSIIAKSGEEFDEDELRVGWRLYFLAQFWLWAREILPDSAEKEEFAKDVQKFGLTSKNPERLKAAFAFAMAKAKALKNIKVEWLKGISVDFDQAALNAGGSAAAIPFNELFQRLNSLLNKAGSRVWLILDRLDEIIIGNEHLENLVLKGLLLAYRDVSEYSNIRLKIFLRDDVYDRVTSTGHFPALTHVRSRAAGPIKWDSDDLMHLIVRRLVENAAVISFLKIDKTLVDENGIMVL